MLAVLRQRNFGLLWFGQAISMIGDWVLFIALPFHIYQVTGSALATGGMFMATTLPGILLGSVAGVFADRWDRKRLMIVSDIARAVMLLVLMLAQTADTIWIIYIVAFLQSTVSQFFFPAKSAVIPLLVGERDLVQANALNSVSDSVTRLLGPSLGGLLMAWGGLTTVVLVDSVSFAVSALMIALIVMPGPKAVHGAASHGAPGMTAVWRDWLAGLRLVRASRSLSVVFVVVAVLSLGDAILTALLVPFSKDVVGIDAQGLGLIMAAQGLGGLVGGVLIGRFARRLTPGQLMAIGGLGNGAVLLVIFNAPTYLLALAAMGLAGVLMSGLMIGMNTAMQAGASDAFRGRVFGALMALGAVMRLGGIAAGGLLADRVGIVPMLDIGAVLFLLCGAAALLMPGVAETAVRPAPVPAVE
ncbi:MAG: MFS transporter [Chloroflexi bacterium]|nr:MFS transporter [Chloroflexota bacterium]